MELGTILVWLVIGLIAGWLASAVVGGGYGLVGDIIVGIVGAFIGGMIFRAAGWGAPFGGLAGSIFVAFIGAIVLLLVLRVLRRGAPRHV
ncbi:MAG TPA: GlsB/YeaQ/YmgE family stress response membrane protein [Myxococcaceae bacterium]|nr:GlsB/YeaQ/YmgE family stress response membrane protein [Myxococcaceae bacterium]